MAKKIKKKSAKSKKHKSSNKKPARNDDLWRTSAFVLGLLLVLSIFTNGFRIGVSADSVMEDLQVLRSKNVPAEIKAAAENSLEEFETAVEKVEAQNNDEKYEGEKLIIYEFAEFACPYCGAATGFHETLIANFKSRDPNWEPSVVKIKEEYDDKVEIVFKHFLVHESARKASEASECARDQGKFWEYHDILFANQDKLDVDSLKKYAKDLGLKTSEFDSCLDNGDKAQLVADDTTYSRLLGITGTPTFLIGGEEGYKVIGAQPYSVFPELIEKALAGEKPEIEPEPEPEVIEIVKSDKPVIELFVMSHCPYGTQIEKGILPVVSVLDENIDFELKYVYYAMHGEVEVIEQLKQYCIQRDQNELFLDYMLCFLKEGDTASCLDEIGVDLTKLESCEAEVDAEFDIIANLEDQASWLSGRFPLFNIDKVANDKYGIRGSPGLVINGQTVSSGRDSASLLNAICERFNNKPEACNIEFSSASPSPGFGFGEAAANNNAVAGCGV